MTKFKLIACGLLLAVLGAIAYVTSDNSSPQTNIQAGNDKAKVLTIP